MEQFTYVKRGYDPEEVDRYISTLEQVIKSYKDKDNAIKNAIISAQVAADNMIKNAKAQADEYKIQITQELEKAKDEVARQRMRIQAFQDVYSGLVRKYLVEIHENDMTDLFGRLDDIEKMITHLMDENEDSRSDFRSNSEDSRSDSRSEFRSTSEHTSHPSRYDRDDRHDDF